MKSVIYINKEKEQDEKPVEFTHFFHPKDRTWKAPILKPKDFKNVIHLGKNEEFDYFISFNHGVDEFPNYYRGHLNSGKY